jgi:hypothetical protein
MRCPLYHVTTAFVKVMLFVCLFEK